MIKPTKEDRDVPEFAAAFMEEFCPDQRDRTLVLGQLLESIDFANNISPDAWSLTMLGRGFRLNVGGVEVMTYNAISIPNSVEIVSELRFLLQGIVTKDIETKLNEDEVTHGIYTSEYKSVPQPQFIYQGLGETFNGSLPDEVYQKLEEGVLLVRQLHENFIGYAAKTPNGKVRTSRFRASHSSGLHSYAKSFTQGTWSEPDMVTTSDIREGSFTVAQATVYERNPLARKKCIAHYGTNCSVCDFSFSATYGNPAEDYIHVHHLNPIASMGKEYVIDPIKDLRPVCANCHAVIHLRQPPYSIKEMQKMLCRQKDE